MKKIFNLPQTANTKRGALEAILKNTGVRDVSADIPTTTLPSLSLIESDKGHSIDQPADYLNIGSRVVLNHEDQGWVTATLMQDHKIRKELLYLHT